MSLVLQLRLCDGLPNFGATAGAFKGEVDLRHAPMGFDVPQNHRKTYAARTNDKGRLDLVMSDIGWHVGSPCGGSSPVTRAPAYARGGKLNHQLSRTQRERLHIAGVCDSLAPPCRRAAMRQLSSRGTACRACVPRVPEAPDSDPIRTALRHPQRLADSATELTMH
jgi:hypothetical protein